MSLITNIDSADEICYVCMMWDAFVGSTSNRTRGIYHQTLVVLENGRHTIVDVPLILQTISNDDALRQDFSVIYVGIYKTNYFR